MSYLIFDTETTGIPNLSIDMHHPAQPHIVQLAAIILDENFNITTELNTLIKPTDWDIPVEAEQIHGWSIDDCEFMGEDIADVIGVFSEMSRQCHTVVAHNLAFDLKMIELECNRNSINCAALKLKPFCTMLNTIDICQIPWKRNPDKFKFPSLEEAASATLGITLDAEKQHDAMYDTEICALIFNELMR